MRKQHWTRLSRVFVVFAVIATALSIPTLVSASCVSNQQSCSGTYGVAQTYFGSGGQICDPNSPSTSPHSTNYCANTNVGELNIGNEKSTTYQAQAGSSVSVNREPYLIFNVGGVATNIGVLSSSSVTDTTANFTVKTYQAGGYLIQIDAQPPQNNAPGHHLLATPGSPTASTPGTEQFGINLVANTTPPALGAAPSCTPDATFCPASTLTPSIAANYSTANKFYYPTSGMNYTDTLASASTSTGSVSYTMSLIYNISNLTPAGVYVYNGVVVATSTY